MKRRIRSIVMDSENLKLSLVGYLFVAILIISAIVFAVTTNPFDQSIFRILYSAIIGGLGGGAGSFVARKLGLTKSSL